MKHTASFADQRYRLIASAEGQLRAARNTKGSIVASAALSAHPNLADYVVDHYEQNRKASLCSCGTAT